MFARDVSRCFSSYSVIISVCSIAFTKLLNFSLRASFKMVWLILAIVLGFLIWFVFINSMNHFTKMGIKQSRPWPILGDQWKVVSKQLSACEFVEWAYNLYPNTRYSGLYQFTLPTLILRDPELIKQITVKDFDHFTDHRAFVDPDADELFGGNLFSLRGQKWRDMRATLSGSFTSSKMKNMFYLMNDAAKNFVNFFLDKNEELIEIELKDAFTKYTNDVIASTAFGIKVDTLAQPNNAFYLMGKKATNLSGLIFRLKFFGYFFVPTLYKWLKIQLFPKDVSDFFTDIINETIRVREEKGIVRQDMLNLLLEAKKGLKDNDNETGFDTAKESTDLNKHKEIKNLSNRDIVAQAMIFFFGGFDTISTVLCFGAYELALSKDVQDKLRQEIMETHKANDGNLTYDSLLKMKYLEMVISEILRKWSPASAIDRVCTKPYTIEPTRPDEKPVHLNIGDNVLLPIHGIHRNPKYYPNPDKFDPDRFSDENKGSIIPYTYIPFGSGPRICIGSRFALLETKALLYYLLLKFEIVPIKQTSIPLKLCKSNLNNTAEGGFWLGLKRIEV